MLLRRKGLLFLLLGTLIFFVALQLTSDSSRVPPVAAVAGPSATKHLSPPSAIIFRSTGSTTGKPPPDVPGIAPSTKPSLLLPRADQSLQPRGPARPPFHAAGIATSTSISIVRNVIAASSAVPHRPLRVKKPFTRDSRLKAAIREQLLKQRVRLEYPKVARMFQLALSHYPVVPRWSVQRIIIVTYFRSGSTFVGDILQANPRTFYHFEPLHMYSNDARLNDTAAREGVALIGRLLRCQFNRSSVYMQWVTKARNQFLLRRNRFLWSHCGLKYSICFKPDFVSGTCDRAPFQIMKLTRLSIAQVTDFVQDKDLGATKLVHLVRDPRGILSSRRLLDWCRSSNCSDYKTLCQEMREDLDAFENLRRDFPTRMIRVRYEDVSINPENETKTLFKNLGLPYSNSVVMFLKTHTKAHRQDVLDPYSTKRNSSTVPFEWRKKLEFRDIQSIQEACKDVLLRLGYKTISRAEELQGDLPIGPIPEAVGTSGTTDRSNPRRVYR